MTPTQLQPREGHPGVMIVGDHWSPDGGTWIPLDREHVHHGPFSQGRLPHTNLVDPYEETRCSNALPYALTPEGRAANAQLYSPGTAAAQPTARAPASPVSEPFQYRQTPSGPESFARSTTKSTSEALPHRPNPVASRSTPTPAPSDPTARAATPGAELVLSTNALKIIERTAAILERQASPADMHKVKKSIIASNMPVTDNAVRDHFRDEAKKQHLRHLQELEGANQMQQADLGRQMREQGIFREQDRDSRALICGSEPPSDWEMVSGTDLVRYSQ